MSTEFKTTAALASQCNINPKQLSVPLNRPNLKNDQIIAI